MTVSTDNYIITHLNNHPEYDVLVTLLDYEIRITDYFKNIALPESDKTLVLIDTALCSGVNPYRFIRAELSADNKIVATTIRYIDLDADILAIANNILAQDTVDLEHSILTESQINKIRGAR